MRRTLVILITTISISFIITEQITSNQAYSSTVPLPTITIPVPMPTSTPIGVLYNDPGSPYIGVFSFTAMAPWTMRIIQQCPDNKQAANWFVQIDGQDIHESSNNFDGIFTGRPGTHNINIGNGCTASVKVTQE